MEPGEPDFGALAVLRHQPAASAVLTDFDGTLAPILADPARARPLPGAAAVLVRLARRFRTVAVVSGRPAAFLLDRVGAAVRDAPANLRLVGLYGLQWVEQGAIFQDPAVDPWLPAVAAAADAADAAAPAGVGVERKGIALALHWRTRPDAADWAVDFGHRWAAERGLHLQPGRMSLELRPPLPADKGAVVERLAAGAAAACFLGDDAGDLAAFAALAERAARGELAAAVRVAVSGAEAPAPLLEAADLVLEGPHAALGFLEELAERLGRLPSP